MPSLPYSRIAPRFFDLTAGCAAKDFSKFYNVIARTPGPLLGLDVGTKHIGVAVSDQGRSVAFPAIGFRRESLHGDKARIRQQMHSVGAVGVVIGMPILRSNKSCGDLQRFIELYAVHVLDGAAAPCAFWDESYTTQMATSKFKVAAKRSVQRDYRRKKKGIDAGAAAEILQEAIDAIASYQLDNPNTQA